MSTNYKPWGRAVVRLTFKDLQDLLGIRRVAHIEAITVDPITRTAQFVICGLGSPVYDGSPIESCEIGHLQDKPENHHAIQPSDWGDFSEPAIRCEECEAAWPCPTAQEAGIDW